MSRRQSLWGSTSPTLAEVLVAIGILATCVALLLPAFGMFQANDRLYEITIIRHDGGIHEVIERTSKVTVRVESCSAYHWRVMAEPWQAPVFDLPFGWTAKIVDKGPVAERGQP